MFEQQLYTRSNAGGFFTKTPGFSTVSASQGFTKNLEKIAPAKYLAITEINKLSKTPKIRYHFFDGTNVIIGQSMQRNEPESRNPILVHNYVSNKLEDIENIDVEVLSADLDFIDSFLESESGKILEEANFVEQKHYSISQNINASILNQLVLTLISNMDQSKKQHVFIVLDVDCEDLTLKATQFMEEIYSYIPYNIRYKIGFNSLFMGNISYELYNNGIQIYFVPREKGIVQNRLGNLSLNNEVVLDFVNDKYSNLFEEQGAFGQFLKESTVEEVNTFYVKFDELINDSRMEQGTLLETLNAYVQLISNSFDDVSHIIKVVNNVNTSVSTKELKIYLCEYINQHQGEFAKQLIAQMLTITELDELSIKMIEQTLAANAGNNHGIIDTISLTNQYEQLNKKLVNDYLVSNPSIMTVYAISLAKNVTNSSEFIIAISRIYMKYPEFVSNSEFKPVLHGLMNHFSGHFTFKAINLNLWDTYDKLKEELPSSFNLYDLLCYQSLKNFEAECSQLTEKDYQNFFCNSKQQEVIDTVGYQTAISMKEIFKNLDFPFSQSEKVERLIVNTLDRFILTTDTFDEKYYYFLMISSRLKNDADTYYTQFFKLLLTNKKSDFAVGLDYALNDENSQEIEILDAAITVLEGYYRDLEKEEQKTLSSKVIKTIKSSNVDGDLASKAIERLKDLQEQYNPSFFGKIGKFSNKHKANGILQHEEEKEAVESFEDNKQRRKARKSKH